MDTYAARLLDTLIAHAPCTKLCLKRESGLSMSTVLRALDDLAREGWAQVESYAVPQGGKPHAKVSVGLRPVYGAARTARGWEVCALGIDGKVLGRSNALPAAGPLAVPANTACDAAHLATEVGQGVACYLSALGWDAYLDERLTLHRAGEHSVALSALPSPMFGQDRLCYGEAFASANPKQKARLTAELTMWISTLLGIENLCCEKVALTDAEACAWACRWQVLHGYL